VVNESFLQRHRLSCGCRPLARARGFLFISNLGFRFASPLALFCRLVSASSRSVTKIQRFSPKVLTADTSKLSPKDRQALARIVAAARLMDPLFLRQVWNGNEALHQKLLQDKSVVGKQRLHYFLINDGPWSRLDNNEPFIEGVPEQKPVRANYFFACPGSPVLLFR